MARLVDLVCKQCNKAFVVTFKQRNRKFCCVKCSQISFKGAGNPAYGKTYRSKVTHPEWVKKISETHKKSDRMLGDNNPMRDPDICAKMSMTRRERVTSDPEYRRQRSEHMRQLWASGKYEGVKVGRCKWYAHRTFDDQLVKLQGTWEVVFARFLDYLRCAYVPHKGRIAYFDDKGVERSYYPDFYVPMWGCYVDVKGAMFYDLHLKKIDQIRTSNPTLNLIVMTREAFNDLGIDVLKCGDLVREESQTKQKETES